jgi:ABC-type transport system substrate-binding protein
MVLNSFHPQQVQTMESKRMVAAALFFLGALSLVILPGLNSRSLVFPGVHLVKANPAPSEYWYPAGPSMNYLQDIIFTEASIEFQNFQTNQIDLTDVPLYSSLVPQYLQSSSYYLAYPAHGSILGVDFNMANKYWGCDFAFGNSFCGVHIRQGIAHLIDRQSFAANSIIAPASVVDDPAGFDLPAPNPCAWDTSFPQSGSGCAVGSSGGTAYHLHDAAGVNYRWQPALGSPDFCAAAQHFINAGLASSKDPNSCELRRISSSVTSFPVYIFVRSDNSALTDLGYSLAQEICALFGQGFNTSCLPYFSYTTGSISSFPGFVDSPNQKNLSWWLYTSGAGSFQSGDDMSDMVNHFQSFTQGIGGDFASLSDVLGDEVASYSSTYTNGGPFNHPQCASTRSSYSPSNYGSVCDPAYDALANQILSAPCFSAQGDPVPGQPAPTFANCPGTNQLTATSAGYKAEDLFGKNVYALPIALDSQPNVYLSNWSRVINSARSGIFSYFTWLNAYASNPATTQSIRQGFSQTTKSVNPYEVSVPWDIAVVRSIYDSLQATDPVSGDVFSWMIYSVVQQDNATVRSQSGYEPPPGTLATYHFNLRDDVFFQDGRSVSAYDVAFSYLSLVGSGATLGAGGSVITGITVLSPRSFDIGVSSSGLFILPYLASVPILPGRYWTLKGSTAWDGQIGQCTGSNPCAKAQYTLSGANVNCPGGIHPGCASFTPDYMQVDPSKIVPTYDPIAHRILVGSGPWQCGTVDPAQGSGSCTSTGTQDPPPSGSYVLTRFGNGLAPASSQSGMYFRASSMLALYIWTQENDVSPIGPVSAVSACNGQPVNPSGPCAHWQQGIGASSSGVVGINQISAVELRYNLNWINPFEWATSPPQGIGSATPVLYEGTMTLKPCSIDPTNGYDC